ncbi:MAG: Spondin domain-containing protein [Bacteroidetes bacterium 38_7]|nr:MAG: Spondin domain-containing protein [Bacteroidetes bacterium 38_7]
MPPNLTYDPPAQPSYISGPACSPHCRDIEVDYFVPAVDKATSYEWDITGIYAAGVTWNGPYATVWSHHYGTATLWCRALNYGVPGPWQTKTIYIENCSRDSNSFGNQTKINKSGKLLTNIECNELQNEVRIYPNPASNIINISVPNSVNYSVVELINNQGETVKSIKSPNRKIVINTNDVSPGLYIIKLSSRNSILLEKVIISK